MDRAHLLGSHVPAPALLGRPCCCCCSCRANAWRPASRAWTGLLQQLRALQGAYLPDQLHQLRADGVVAGVLLSGSQHPAVVLGVAQGGPPRPV